MSKMEKAIVATLELLEEHARTESNEQMSNAELSALIKTQLRSPEFQNKVDQEDIREALEKMDKDHDGQVNFRDFNQSVSILAQGCVNYGKGKGKDKCKAKDHH